MKMSRTWMAAFAMMSLFIAMLPLKPISASSTSGSGEIVLVNPGFEEPLVNGKIPGWSFYWSPLTEGYSIEVTTEQKAAGSYSLKMIDSGGKSLGLISDNIPVTAGETYRTRAKVYLDPTSRDGVSVHLKYYDAGNKELTASSSVSFNGTRGQWADLEFESAAPQGAVKARIWLYSGVAQHSVAYFDELSVTQVPALNLPFEFGNPVDLGPATVTAKSVGGAIGNNEVYFATNGSPSTFYVLDAFTGAVKFSQPVPGVSSAWAVTVAPDGNCYFAGSDNGRLYRYNPTTRTLEDLGVNPSDKVVWDLAPTGDGKIYGATYPNSKIFEYDIATNTFRDLGTVLEGVKYARGIGATDETIYVGLGTPVHLYKIDRATGAKTEIMLPHTGANDMIADIWSYNGKLFVRSGATSLYILDAQTEEVLKALAYPDPVRFDSMISSPSPLHPELIYFRNPTTSELYTYNTSTNEVAVVPGVLLPDSTVRAYDWITPASGVKAGKTLLAMITDKLEYVLYDPQDNSLQVIIPDVVPQGIDIQSLEMGPDGKLYMGGFQAALTIYDPSRNVYERQERVFPQIEGIGFLNGKVYFGTYGGAVIYRYDPSQPYQKGVNPALAYDIGEFQSRPFAFASGDNKLFIGTIADYGRVDGALTVYDESTGTWSVFRNVVKDQSVMSVAYQNGLVYGGTTIYGGGGSNPVASEAKMFVWDVAAQTKVAEFSPQIPGMRFHKLIGDLSFGPDGLLWGVTWGVAQNGTPVYSVFAMDPASHQVKKSRLLYPNAPSGSTWRPYFLRWSADGLLYTTIGRSLTVIDPATMSYKKLLNHADLMTLADNGDIYYAEGSHLKLLPVPLSRVELSPDRAQLVRGETANLLVNAVLVNGKPANLSRAQIVYTSSDPNVVTVTDGMMTGNNAGSAQITVTVTLDGVTVVSNVLNVEVEVTVASLEKTIAQLETAATVQHPLAAQLKNSLKQAAHHLERGNAKQAVKHLEDFIKHLDNEAMEKFIEASAKQVLLADANALLQDWIAEPQ